MLVTEGLSTRVIIITVTTGGTAGFILSWFAAGASLVVPSVLILTFLTRNVAQEIVNQSDYAEFKKLITQMLKEDELKEPIRLFFMEGEVRTKTPSIEMKPLYSEKNSLPKVTFKSDQPVKEKIKRRKIKIKPTTVKTVYFKNFVKKLTENSDDIIDAKIFNEPIKVKTNNEKP